MYKDQTIIIVGNVSMPENGYELDVFDSRGKFRAGHACLPGCGRPKGSRSKLGDSIYDDFYNDWKEHGIQVIEQVRQERPWDYLKIVALLMTKEDGSAASRFMDSVNLAEVEKVIEARKLEATKKIEAMNKEDKISLEA